MINKEQKIVNLIMKSILFFPILTVLQGIPFLSNVNKIWMVLVLFELILSFKYLKYRTFDFFILFITIVIHIVAFFYTKEDLYNINMVFYLFVWVLFYIFCAAQNKYLINFLYTNKQYLKIIISLWTMIILVSIFIPSCYNTSGAFQSFADKPFRVMPSTLVITALLMFLTYSEKKNKYYFLLIPIIYTAIMGASRTYFIVFIIFLFTYFYEKTKNKRNFLISFMPMFSILLLLTFFSNIGYKFLDKIYSNNTYYDFWGNITSGRTVFWRDDIIAFFNLSPLQQFVGNGYNFVFNINASHGYIWAHNDIINLLMNFGYIGVVIYLYAFYRMYNTNKLFLSRVARFMFLLAIIINSMFNMSYTYLCAFISYPIFLIVFREQRRNKNVHN